EGLPESKLLGVATPRKAGNNPETLQADGNNFPERVAYQVQDPSPNPLHRFFKHTGLGIGTLFGARGWCLATSEFAPGQFIPATIDNSGASGGECDRRDEFSLVDVQVLARGQNTGPFAEMTYYDHHPGGGFVFSVGSISFGGSLIINQELQQIVY